MAIIEKHSPKEGESGAKSGGTPPRSPAAQSNHSRTSFQSHHSSPNVGVGSDAGSSLDVTELREQLHKERQYKDRLHQRCDGLESELAQLKLEMAARQSIVLTRSDRSGSDVQGDELPSIMLNRASSSDVPGADSVPRIEQRTSSSSYAPPEKGGSRTAHSVASSSIPIDRSSPAISPVTNTSRSSSGPSTHGSPSKRFGTVSPSNAKASTATHLTLPMPNFTSSGTGSGSRNAGSFAGSAGGSVVSASPSGLTLPPRGSLGASTASVFDFGDLSWKNLHDGDAIDEDGNANIDMDLAEAKLLRWLEECGVNTATWGHGRAKTLGHLTKELANGFGVLSRPSGDVHGGVSLPKRRINVLCTRLKSAQAPGMVCRQKYDQLWDARLRFRPNKPRFFMGMKLTAAQGEAQTLDENLDDLVRESFMRSMHIINWIVDAERVCEQMEDGPDVLHVDKSSLRHEVVVEESDSYPGLETVYGLFTVDATHDRLPPHSFHTVTLGPDDQITGLSVWDWEVDDRIKSSNLATSEGAGKYTEPFLERFFMKDERLTMESLEQILIGWGYSSSDVQFVMQLANQKWRYIRQNTYTDDRPDTQVFDREMRYFLTIQVQSVMFAEDVSVIPSFNEAEKALLLKLFPDVPRADVSAFQRGRSGSRVLRVDCAVPGQPMETSVVKMDMQEVIKDEVSRMKRITPLLGPNAVQLLEVAFLNGIGCMKLALIGGAGDVLGAVKVKSGDTVETLEDQVHKEQLHMQQAEKSQTATGWRAAIKRSQVVRSAWSSLRSSAQKTFAVLFGDILRGPSQQKATKCPQVNWLSEFDLRHKIVKHVLQREERIDPSVQPQSLDELIPGAKEFFKRLLEVMEKNEQRFTNDMWMGYVHGDLNGRNILIDHNEYVWVIDFAQSDVRYALTDLAKIETCLMFEYTVLDNDSELDIAMAISANILSVKSLEDSFNARPPVAAVTPKFELMWNLVRRIRKYVSDYCQGLDDPLHYHMKMLAILLQMQSFREPSLYPLNKKWALAVAMQIGESIMTLLGENEKKDRFRHLVTNASLLSTISSSSTTLERTKGNDDLRKYITSEISRNWFIVDAITRHKMDLRDNLVAVSHLRGSDRVDIMNVFCEIDKHFEDQLARDRLTKVRGMAPIQEAAHQLDSDRADKRRNSSGPAPVDAVTNSQNQMKKFDESNRVILLGAAASGKTCLMKRGLVDCAEAWLDAHSQGAPVPILISLVDLGRILHTRAGLRKKHNMMDNKTLSWEAIVELSLTRIYIEEDPVLAELMNEVRKGNVHLFLDGLDECGSQKQRITEWIAEMHNAENTPKRIVISSRHTGFEPDLFGGFQFFFVAPLSLELQENFIDRRLAPLDAHLAKRIRSEVLRPEYMDVCQSPLMLSLLIAVLEITMGNRSAPGMVDDTETPKMNEQRPADQETDQAGQQLLSREAIYSIGFKYMLHKRGHVKYAGRRNAEDDVRAQELEMLASPECLSFLEKLAYHVHLKKMRDVRSADLIEVFLEMIQEPNADASFLNDVVNAVISSVRSGTVPLFLLLHEDYQDFHVTFRLSHLTFQEYLAGRHVATQLDAAYTKGHKVFKKVLSEIMPSRFLQDPWWREVWYFVAGALMNMTDGVMESVAEVISAQDETGNSGANLVLLLKMCMDCGQHPRTQEVFLLLRDKMQDLRSDSMVAWALCHPSQKLRSLVLTEINDFGLPVEPLFHGVMDFFDDESTPWYCREAALQSIGLICGKDAMQQKSWDDSYDPDSKERVWNTAVMFLLDVWQGFEHPPALRNCAALALTSLKVGTHPGVVEVLNAMYDGAGDFTARKRVMELMKQFDWNDPIMILELFAHLKEVMNTSRTSWEAIELSSFFAWLISNAKINDVTRDSYHIDEISVEIIAFLNQQEKEEGQEAFEFLLRVLAQHSDRYVCGFVLERLLKYCGPHERIGAAYGHCVDRLKDAGSLLERKYGHMFEHPTTTWLDVKPIGMFRFAPVSGNAAGVTTGNSSTTGAGSDQAELSDSGSTDDLMPDQVFAGMPEGAVEVDEMFPDHFSEDEGQDGDYDVIGAQSYKQRVEMALMDPDKFDNIIRELQTKEPFSGDGRELLHCLISAQLSFQLNPAALVDMLDEGFIAMFAFDPLLAFVRAQRQRHSGWELDSDIIDRLRQIQRGSNRVEATFIYKEIVCGREEEKIDHLHASLPAVELQTYHTPVCPMNLMLAETFIDLGEMPMPDSEEFVQHDDVQAVNDPASGWDMASVCVVGIVSICTEDFYCKEFYELVKTRVKRLRHFIPQQTQVYVWSIAFDEERPEDPIFYQRLLSRLERCDHIFVPAVNAFLDEKQLSGVPMVKENDAAAPIKKLCSLTRSKLFQIGLADPVFAFCLWAGFCLPWRDTLHFDWFKYQGLDYRKGRAFTIHDVARRGGFSLLPQFPDDLLEAIDPRNSKYIDSVTRARMTEAIEIVGGIHIPIPSTEDHYTGDRDDQGRYHGQGRMRWRNGSCYEGPWVHGKRSGDGGVWYSSTGHCYAGSWENDLPHGQGELKRAANDLVDCNCTLAAAQYFGVLRFEPWSEKGDIYSGQFSYDGRGVMHKTFTWLGRGDTYKGPWQRGLPHGDGVVKYASGGNFTGSFRKGFKHGYGENFFGGGRTTLHGVTMAPGDTFVGWYVMGKREGLWRRLTDVNQDRAAALMAEAQGERDIKTLACWFENHQMVGNQIDVNMKMELMVIDGTFPDKRYHSKGYSSTEDTNWKSIFSFNWSGKPITVRLTEWGPKSKGWPVTIGQLVDFQCKCPLLGDKPLPFTFRGSSSMPRRIVFTIELPESVRADATNYVLSHGFVPVWATLKFHEPEHKNANTRATMADIGSMTRSSLLSSGSHTRTNSSLLMATQTQELAFQEAPDVPMDLPRAVSARHNDAGPSSLSRSNSSRMENSAQPRDAREDRNSLAPRQSMPLGGIQSARSVSNVTGTQQQVAVPQELSLHCFFHSDPRRCENMDEDAMAIVNNAKTQARLRSERRSGGGMSPMGRSSVASAFDFREKLRAKYSKSSQGSLKVGGRSSIASIAETLSELKVAEDDYPVDIADVLTLTENMIHHLDHRKVLGFTWRWWQDAATDDLVMGDLPPLDEASFKLMQFNFLAEGLAAGPKGSMELTYEYQGSDLARFDRGTWRHGTEVVTPFPHTVVDYHNLNCHGNFLVAESKPEAFDWRTRKLRLLWEVLREEPDLLTAVEVDHYNDFFEPVFNLVGYDGIWVPKVDSPSLGTGHYSDGVVLAWKRDKFEKFDSREGWLKRETLKEVMEAEDGNADEDSANKTSHVGVCAVVATLKSLTVANTYLIIVGFHLKSSEGQANENTRMAQLAILGNTVDEQLTKLRSKTSKDAKVSVVFSGDCNSDPIDLPKHEQRADVMRWFSGVDAKVNRAPVRLQSAYKVPEVSADPSVVSPSGGIFTKDGDLQLTEYPATSVKTRRASGFKAGYKCRMSDFIWYGSGLTCEYRLWFPFTLEDDLDRELLPETWREEFEAEITALPGYRYPSDHFAISSVLKFTNE